MKLTNRQACTVRSNESYLHNEILFSFHLFLVNVKIHSPIRLLSKFFLELKYFPFRISIHTIAKSISISDFQWRQAEKQMTLHL